MDSHYGHMYMRCYSAVQTTVYNTSTITQIAIVLFLFKARLETSRFVGLYQLTIILKHFKYELSSCQLK